MIDIYYAGNFGYGYIASCESIETAMDAILATGRTWDDDLGDFVDADQNHISASAIRFAKRVKYSEYKTKYARCRTIKDSYDPASKTIIVLAEEP